MVQILLKWDEESEEDKKIIDRLIKGFDKMGCWKETLPPQGSIYRMMLIAGKENTETNKR